MATHPTPIRARPATRDPLRNFKFRLQWVHPDASINNRLGEMGFMSVDGINLNTEMIPYREGGDNTSPRKLPGQSDFGPLTLTGGVFMHDAYGQWEWMKQIFRVIWGEGNAAFNDEFRADMILYILKHPVTRFSTGGEGDPNSRLSAGAAFKFYNCWPASIAFNGMNAADNSIFVSQMVMHHEGFDPQFGVNAQRDFPA